MNHEAVYKTHSNVATIRNDVAYDENENVVKLNETVIQAYIDAHAHILKRQAEYPPIGDQLDALYKAGVFPAELAAQIKAVKDKYPKGVS
jgi:uncharacterized protein YutE (UPF0331/DUF86 family)